MTQTRGPAENFDTANIDTAGLDTAGLNTALSEATCLGLEVDNTARTLRLTLEVLALPDDIASGEISDTPESTSTGSARDAALRILTLSGVRRVAASLRAQYWDDREARVLPLQLDGLTEAISSFGGGRLHGWEFVDLDDSGWTLWSELLSFDTTLDQGVAAHVIEFSQEEGLDPRELDVRVWFDALTIRDGSGTEIALSDFISNGAKWWRAHDAGDPATLQPGVVPQL